MDDRSGLYGFRGSFSSRNAFKNVAQYYTDTTLRMNSASSSCLNPLSLRGTKRKCDVDGNRVEDSSLVLGLGRPSNSSDSSRRSSATACTMSSAKETDDGSSMDLGLKFDFSLSNENTGILKKPSLAVPDPKVDDLQLSLSIGPSKSVITNASSVSIHDYFEKTVAFRQVSTVDEVSSSSSSWSRRKLLPYLHSADKAGVLFIDNMLYDTSAPVGLPDFSLTTVMQPPKASVATSGVSKTQQHNNNNTKNCQFPGCSKGARGASGLCIAHGGGQRCQKTGCQRGAEGRTIFCKAHGGGRRCQHLGCTKSAEGHTDYCIAHGGGRRCRHDGCTKAARGKSGLCIKHGGGKRCQKENCTKSAEGHSGLCIAHGGGRRCKYPECTKGAQGSTNFCKAHGGGKRCTHSGCTKGAEGSTPFCKAHGGGKRCAFEGGCTKSVHGGTNFCVAHGGGKRCAVPECTKSARGRTDLCVRHGGGKRCKAEGCGKSAQGSTDFCKAHGGGKRCSWDQPGSSIGRGGPPCDRFARGKIGLCAAHAALVEDQCVHGGLHLASVSLENPAASKPEKMNEIVDLNGSSEMENGKSTLLIRDGREQKEYLHSAGPRMAVSLPEGRVHGGSLLAMLSRNAASLDGNTSGQVDGGHSEQPIPRPAVGYWI